MAKTKKKKEKILFTDIKVEGYTVKPFSLGVTNQLAPSLEVIGTKLLEKGVTINNLDTEIPKVIFTILPELPAVFNVLLDEKIEVINEFHISKVLSITLVIMTQNLEYLKNSLGPLKQIIQALKNPS